MVFQGRQLANFSLLYFATIAAQLGNLAYQAQEKEFSFLSQLVPSVLFLSVLTIPALLVGLLLGPKVGIAAFDNRPSVNRAQFKQAIVFTIVSSILLGSALLVLRWMLLAYLPAEIPEYGFRGFAGGTVVSISAAVGEEVWFRFGLMTLALWAAQKFVNNRSLTIKHVLPIIVGIGVLFGLAHLPQLASFGADTQFAVWATILGNISVSILFGWCFWRYGLVYAILAHFSLDMVLHALPALFI
ncbi:CPBP family intramembrane metalloprotease [Aliiglaciecola sp.]|nr:CPBP family intramembrane metalloprotease [Aliiglaciecola sp.]